MQGRNLIRSLCGTVCMMGLLAPFGATAVYGQSPDRIELPKPATRPAQRIGRDLQSSGPEIFPQMVVAQRGSANVLLIMTDDTGFGAASTFGGPVPTPNLDRLAARGLVYNNFHTTGLCSPTRAALLTGRNAHAAQTGLVVEGARGYPGYYGEIPRSTATIAEVLRQNGYSTAMFGKHHNTPRWLSSPAGPFDSWPTGLGFEYFYGFIAGDSDQYQPTLYRGTSRVDAPAKPDYILDADLADQAISWIHMQKGAAPDRPFFIYYAPGTSHAPHQAPRQWIDRFRGKFDAGWDTVRNQTIARQKRRGIVPGNAEVSPRPHDIPGWATLTPRQRQIYARMMEVSAGMLAFQDEQIGRVVNELERMGQLDNTLVIFIEGDNGASAEGGLQGTTNELGLLGNNAPESEDYLASVIDELGGPKHFNNYPAGWAWAMDAPFPFFKQIASHLGAVRNGMVVSWPGKIAPSARLRSQFEHVIDVAPTILEATGIAAPTRVNGVDQRPMDGISFAHTFEAQGDKDIGRHKLQYFEVKGNISLYSEGWLLSTTPRYLPWTMARRDGRTASNYNWELYNLRKDFAQARDVSASQPNVLQRLQELWWQEARRNQVLPIIEDHTNPARFTASLQAHGLNRARSTYWGVLGMPEGAAPALRSRSFTIEAKLTLPERATGVILASGGRFGGWSFYLTPSEVVAYSALTQQPEHQFRVAGPAPGAGNATIRFEFDYDGGGPGKGGLMKIYVNGMQIASGRIDRTVTLPQNGEEFDIGYDAGTNVSPDYLGDYRLTGQIERVDVTLR